jgi:hypothetical protein
MNRGSAFDLTPDSFNDPTAQKSTQIITTMTGNLIDTAPYEYYNACYSGWAGIKGGGEVSLTIRSGASNVSIWVDDDQVFTSLMTDFNEVSVGLTILTRSYIQIFWYSPVSDNTFSITGDIAFYLSMWETSDNSPFARQVEWYTETPITSDSIVSLYPREYVKLRWWFGEDTSEESETIPGGVEPDAGGVPSEGSAMMGGDFDIGGFGIWTINFQNIGEIDVLDENTISVYGYYPNMKYFRILGTETIYKVEYVSGFHSVTSSTNIVITAHGLTDDDDGAIAEAGIIKHIQDVPISTFTSNTSDIYEAYDFDIVRGTRYYYLVDTFDSSPNKNRGGITETYQTIIAGDFTAPAIVTNVSSIRNAYDSVTVSWDDQNPLDIRQWNVYSDVYSTDYTLVGGHEDVLFIATQTTEFIVYFSTHPNCLVSIELNSGAKYVRRVSRILGASIYLNIPLPESPSAGDVLRIMSIVSSLQNGNYITIDPPVTPPIEPVPLDANPL